MLEHPFADKRDAIVERWLDAILGSYPSDSARFFKRERDRFANPAGHLYAEGVPKLVDAVLAGAVGDQVASSLEPILKLRALQDLSPSKAVGFTFQLKQVLREVAGQDVAGGWQQLDGRVDALALVAFDVYMRCRERVYEVRYDQLKKMNHVMLKRAERMLNHRLGLKDEEAGLEESDPESQNHPEDAS